MSGWRGRLADMVIVCQHHELPGQNQLGRVAIVWGSGANDGVWFDSGVSWAQAVFGGSSAATVALATTGSGAITLDSATTLALGAITSLTLGSAGTVQINVGSNLTIATLPTSTPGGSGRVWNDGGTLKIT